MAARVGSCLNNTGLGRKYRLIALLAINCLIKIFCDLKFNDFAGTTSRLIFRLANQTRKENVDVDDKPVKNDAGEMSMSEKAKLNAWAEHYERLLNVEFDWDPDHLSNEPPLEGPPVPITIDMVKKVISKMKSAMLQVHQA